MPGDFARAARLRLGPAAPDPVADTGAGATHAAVADPETVLAPAPGCACPASPALAASAVGCAASCCRPAGLPAPAPAGRDRHDLAAIGAGGAQAAPALLLRLTVPGEFGAVRLALSQVMAALDPLALTRECRDATELVLAEVLNNIVEHAYASWTGPIELDLRLEGPLLACTVRDRGAPMPDGHPPSGRQALLDVPLADLPEGGFGWFLIRNLTCNIHYTRAADGNRLGFAIPIERGVPTG